MDAETVRVKFVVDLVLGSNSGARPVAAVHATLVLGLLWLSGSHAPPQAAGAGVIKRKGWSMDLRIEGQTFVLFTPRKARTEKTTQQTDGGRGHTTQTSMLRGVFGVPM